MSEAVFYKETNLKDESLIGEIPKDWESVDLGEVVEVHDSKRIPLSEMERKNRKGKYPYCGANGIIDYIDDYIFDGEFVLLAEDGGSYGKFENTAYIMSGRFWVNNHAHILKAMEGKTSNLFLKYALDFLDLNPYIVGSTRKKLNQEQMRKIRIPLPPVEEQRGIAGVLGVVDSAVELVDRVIAKTERLKKGLMQTLLTRGIGHTEYKQTPIGTTPKTWEIVKLGDLAETITKGTTPTTFGFNFTESGINFIKVESIDEHGNFISQNIPHINEEANKALSRSILKEDDILFSIAGALGRVAIVTKEVLPANVNQALAIIRLRRNDKLLLKYLEYYLRGPLIQDHIKTIAVQSAQANLTLAQVKDFMVTLPPLNEQQRITETLSAIDKKLTLEKKEKTKLEVIKRGLMDLLLTGKIRVKVD